MAMKFQYLALPACLLLWLTGVAHGQATAQLRLSAVNVDAGESVTADLTLPSPASCDQIVLVQYNEESPLPTIMQLRGEAAKGGTNVHLTFAIPRDRKAGVYHSTKGYLLPCPGLENSHEFAVPASTVTVRAVPDTNVYPTNADMALSVTQKQFFDTKIAELNKLDQQITTRVENHAADLPELRQFLIQIVTSADRDLSVTGGQYREIVLKSAEKPLPAFFADFHKQYQTLLIQLRAPIPGLGRNEPLGQAKLVYVQQLKQRKPLPENLSGTYPSSVKDTRSTMRDNRAAYRILKDTGRLTFPAVLTTHPTGAHIFYKKLIDDDYTDYSGVTDVQASLELATWSFKFHLQGCTDEIRQINPFNEVFDDQHPVEVTAGFEHCRGR